jgi:hypothetical protein
MLGRRVVRTEQEGPGLTPRPSFSVRWRKACAEWMSAFHYTGPCRLQPLARAPLVECQVSLGLARAQWVA